MRVLLRRVTNGFYYQGTGKWINNLDKGLDFGSIHQAIDYARNSRPEDLELVLDFENSQRISAVSLWTALAG